MRPLDYVIEQLWAPAMQDGDVRVVTDGRVESGWREVERYWLVPNASSARLLLPCGPSRVTYAATTNYRHLRIAKANISRVAAGALARAHLPLSAHTVSVQVRTESPGAAAKLPVAIVAEALGKGRLYAALGVRTAENRKATLYLLDETGRPAGYAKFGWTPVTDALVTNEAKYLKQIGGVEGATRAPGVLAELDYHGHPVVVTEPLPLNVSGTPTSVPPPTSKELFWLTPVVRQATPAATEQFAGLLERLRRLTSDDLVRPVAVEALRLAEEVGAIGEELPVTARWHGDMTPWNRARETGGQLWVWDWESAEDDAIAGLDAIHWAFSQRRLVAAHVNEVTLDACTADASHHLVAAGVPRASWSVVAAVYSLTVLERACTIAHSSGTWHDALISPEDLSGLLRHAESMLRERG